MLSVCLNLPKIIGGNFAVGAFGGKEKLMREIENGAAHYGTYNANHLALRAIITQLRDVLTEEAYDHVETPGAELVAGYEEIMAEHDITGHVEHVNSQGIVAFTDKTIRNYCDWLGHVDEEFHENYWFGMLNQGVMPHPHHASQQWTISVQHTEEHVQERLDAFENIAPRLAEEQSR